MPQRVLIRFHADGGSEWLALARDGTPQSPVQTGLPAAADDVTLLLPAEDVLLLAAPRLPGRGAQLAQALAYAIEEQLAGAVEQQHVAFVEGHPGPGIPTAVVARTRIDAWLTRLAEAGLMADRAYGLGQCLPVVEDAVTVFCDPQACVLRPARDAALAGGAADLPELLRLLADAGETRGRLRVLLADGAREPSSAEGWRSEIESIGAALPWLASRLRFVTGPDLLQGGYRARRRVGKGRRWRIAFGLAAAAALVAFVQLGAERAALERHAEARQADMAALLREALPEVQRVVDPVAQLGAALERRAGAPVGGALPLLAKIAPHVSGSGRYTLEGLDYRAGVLELTVSAPDVAALDSLRELLAALPALQVELTSALPGSNGVEGRLRIREGAA